MTNEALNTLKNAILNNPTFNVQEDEWSGSLFITLHNGDTLFCSPNCEGTEIAVCFELGNEDGYIRHWNQPVLWTGDVEKDLAAFITVLAEAVWAM